MRIGVIGAGAGAAAAAYVLEQSRPEAEVTVLEKSGGLCGRAATRRRDAVTYDYGANYVRDADERVVELLTEGISTEGLVDIEGPIYTFDKAGTVSPGRESDHRKWTYRAGLTQVAKRLFAATDAEINRRTRVQGLSRAGDAWHLTDTDGGEWGPFDALLCNPPAPQTAALLSDAQWESGVRQELVEALEEVVFRTIWTAVLGYGSELDVPYYALVNPSKDHEVGWIAREECKPGHVPAGESVLVVQANHDWSVQHLSDSPKSITGDLAELTASVVGEERLTDPEWADDQRWRYAIPENGVDSSVVDSAAEHGLYLLGDWVAGEGRLHAALANGLETGEQVAVDLVE